MRISGAWLRAIPARLGLATLGLTKRRPVATVTTGDGSVSLPMSAAGRLRALGKRAVEVKPLPGVAHCDVHLRARPVPDVAPDPPFIAVVPGTWYRLRVQVRSDDPGLRVRAIEFGGGRQLGQFALLPREHDHESVFRARPDAESVVLVLRCTRAARIELGAASLLAVCAPRFALDDEPGTGVILGALPVPPEVAAARPTARPGRGSAKRDYVWSRAGYVHSIMRRGGDALECGPGYGELLRTMDRGGDFRSLTAIDNVRFRPRLARELPHARLEIMDLAQLRFPDRTFDTVTCLQVLEHLEPDDFEPALANLRRVCRGQLVVSVPYHESLPLPEHHRQRFARSDVERWFPAAQRHVLYREGGLYPYVLLLEDHEAR